MQEFRIRPGGFDHLKKRLIITTSILFAFIFVAIVLLPALLSDEPGRFDTLPFMIILFGGIGVFSVMNGIKKQRKLFESFRLKMDDEKFVREQLNTATITILYRDITEITKLSNGSFCIVGNSKLNAIGIPATIENYETLEAQLNRLKPVLVRTSSSWSEKLIFPFSLAVVLLMIVPFAFKNDLVTLIASLMIVLILSVCLYIIQVSKNVDRRTKTLGWISLIPLLAFLVMAWTTWQKM